MSKESPSEKKDLSLSYVTLTTWGTHSDGGNGMSHFLDVQLFGGNVGHASVAVTFPADETGVKMLEHYCYKDGEVVLPFERTSHQALDENGKLVSKDVFTVYFSWWPDKTEKLFSLRSAINEDSVAERLGVESRTINPRFDLAPLEERIYRGQLGSKRVQLPVKNIAHQRGLSKEEFDLLELERKCQVINDDLESIGVLLKKLSSSQDGKPIVISATLTNLLDHYIKDWRATIGNVKQLTVSQAQALIEKVTTIRSGYNQTLESLQSELRKGIEKRNVAKNELLKLEVNNIKAQLGSLQGKALKNKINEIKDKFSPLSWLDYERDKLMSARIALQSLRTFLRQYFDLNENREVILQALFDDKFPEGYKFDNWREFLPEALQNMNREDLTPKQFIQLKNLVNAELKMIDENIKLISSKKPLYTTVDPLFEHGYDQFVSKGLPPDDKVTLPVGGMLTDDKRRNGLNIESMLIKMREITDSGKPFNLEVNNCSVTTGAILAAGAQPEFKSMLERKAWGGGFGTPQEVLNGAMNYQNTLLVNNGKLSLAQKLNKYNPLNGIAWMGGKILKGLVDPSTPTIDKIALGIAGVPVAALALVNETLKAILNPKKSFNLCRGFISYAWENNSIFLKACSLPVALFAGVFAIPAGIQFAAQKIISPIGALFKRKRKPKPEAEQSVSIFNQNHYVEIESKNAILALNQLAHAFKTQMAKIPVFTSQTQVIVDKYLSKLDRRNPNEAHILSTYQEMVLAINKRVNDLTPKPLEKEKPAVAPLPLKPEVFKRAKPTLFKEKPMPNSDKVKLGAHRVAIKTDRKSLNGAVHAMRLKYEEKIKEQAAAAQPQIPKPKHSGKT